MKLLPSLSTFLFKIAATLVAFGCLIIVLEGLPIGYLAWGHFLVGAALFAVFAPVWVWLTFVPATFEMSDDQLYIRFWLRRAHKIDWSELKVWGEAGEGLFLIRFNRQPIFQIAFFAFPKRQRQEFVGFLSRRFPERQAKVWFGVWGIR